MGESDELADMETFKSRDSLYSELKRQITKMGVLLSSLNEAEKLLNTKLRDTDFADSIKILINGLEQGTECEEHCLQLITSLCGIAMSELANKKISNKNVASALKLLLCRWTHDGVEQFQEIFQIPEQQLSNLKNIRESRKIDCENFLREQFKGTLKIIEAFKITDYSPPVKRIGKEHDCCGFSSFNYFTFFSEVVRDFVNKGAEKPQLPV